MHSNSRIYFIPIYLSEEPFLPFRFILLTKIRLFTTKTKTSKKIIKKTNKTVHKQSVHLQHKQ